MKVIGIDPSIATPGLVVAGNGQLYYKEAPHTYPKETDPVRLNKLYQATLSIITSHEPEAMVIEVPNNWKVDRNKGKVMKLMKSIGTFEAAGFQSGIPVHEVPVSTWKGPRKKSNTAQTMILKYNLPIDLPSHIYDALGVADWWMSNDKIGELIRGQRKAQEVLSQKQKTTFFGRAAFKRTKSPRA